MSDYTAFTVPQGSSAAIVGPSGAGKTTVANLFLRFWDYEVGEICLGADSLKVLDPNEALR